MYKLSIGAIAKNEHFGLEEWVNYHRVVGVEHFYIYDNDSSIPISKVLEKYISAGIVTLIEFHGPSKQMPAYNHCLNSFGIENEWIAFIDCDEFLLPKQTDYVPDILDKFTNYGSLQVNWLVFGSNGHIARPSGLVMEDYTKSSEPGYHENLHTKAIVQPKYTLSAGMNPHYFNFKNGKFAVSEKFERVPNAWSAKHSAELIQINHYTCKSLEDFQMKINKGRADAAHLPTRKIDDIKDIDKYCNLDNYEILRFVDRTKNMYLV